MKQIGLAIGSLVISLWVCEFFLRASSVLPSPVVPSHVGMFDSELGWTLRPNVRASNEVLGYPVLYETNSQGLRDEEHPYERTKGKFRIVLLGDSRTFGFGVNIEDHFSKLLEKDLPGVEVVNLGVSGYGVDQMLLRLKKDGLKYSPDLVVVYVPHYGDHRHVHTNRFGQEKPMFVMNGSELTLTNSPVSTPSFGSQLHRWFSNHSELYRFLCVFFEIPVFGFVRENPVENADQEKLEELAARLIDEFSSVSRASGARFLLLTPLPDLKEHALNSGFPVFDVGVVLDKADYSLPKGASHINPEGNKLLSKALAEFLLENFAINPDS